MIALNLIQKASRNSQVGGDETNSVEHLSQYLNHLWEWIPGTNNINSLWVRAIHYAPDHSPVHWDRGVGEIVLTTLSNSLSWFKKPSIIVTALVIYGIYKTSNLYKLYAPLFFSIEQLKRGDYQLAIDSAYISLDRAKKIGNRSLEARAYNQIGKAHQHLGNYSKALKYHEKRLVIAKALGDRAGEGIAYASLGVAHKHLCNYLLAIKYHQRALEVDISLGDRAREGNAYAILGNVYNSLGNYPKAIEYHEKSLAIALALGDQASEGSAYTNLGNVHDSLGNYPKAIEYHEKSFAIALESGNRAQVGMSYGNLGIVHRSLGNYLLALKYQEKALEIAVDLGVQVAECNTYANIGNVHLSLCSYSQATDFHKKSLAITLALGDRSREGKSCGNIGAVYNSLGNYSQAIEYQEKYLEIAVSLRNRAGEGIAYANLGNAHCSLGNYPQAIEYLEKCLEITVALGDQAGEGRVYANLGVVYASLGNFPQAIEYHEKSLEVSLALDDRPGEGVAYGNLGNAHCYLDNYAKAVWHQEKFLVIAQELRDSDAIGNAHNNLGASYVKLEDYTRAEIHFQKGISTYSSLRSSLKDRYHAKITIFEKQSKAYFGLEEVLLLQDREREALVVSDSRRSRTLIDRIQSKLSLDTDIDNAPFQIEEMQKFAEKIGTTFVVFSFDPRTDKRQQFGTWIIHPGQAIVYRSLNAPSIFEAMQKGSITPFQDMDNLETKGGDGLDGLFANLPSSPLITEVETEQIAFLQDWYNELIAPIFDELPTETDARITLVPDGPLMDLPFALLMDPEGKYLFEKYTLSITPSIKTLHLLTQREVFPSGKNLIVGNPTTLDKSSLPLSSKEANVVAEISGTSPERTLVGREALKSAVLAGLEGSRFIHFACHGEVKAKATHSIYDGAFYLAPDEVDPDGILYAEEIVACDLNAELVLLSACHSGKGRHQQEGVIGPVRSFLAAGAQAVVATLWALPDSGLTIAMVSQFYEHILGTSKEAQAEGRPLDKDEALREVMRMAASEGARNRPQEWGAFFMTGALQPRS